MNWTKHFYSEWGCSTTVYVYFVETEYLICAAGLEIKWILKTDNSTYS